ncbi:BREX-2 system adenine-specific DNA-methyltransferase PglX [Streptomyces sp. NBC_01481]|uniref:BREX-2 system adenine-specific DNA-methyltransferase PglX n=1 Tax=Streptomyces sp. NBC_01481 TaxID=2975869 RepID=UPI002257F23E|nr:BREX-2 system adenine-specific DNA-methyltransferase PglX [Streptomyces sp. NBC_01481]MCX4587026.1 BREX-2 system adenine-specific DNA-methyltransferase PglX [Streptomyces sp. NBC_01481]
MTTVAGAGVDRAGLLKDLKKQVTALENDLRERSESVEEFRTRLEVEYARARESKRTAATYGAWRDERVIQAAAAWVLGCVFVRFCEDNGLIEWPFLAGPGERLRDAEERHEAFFREKPHLNNRDWLVEAFQHLADANETAAGLFARAHNPLWELTPSYEAASELLAFWRRRGADGEILYDFTDAEWDTRFLGDLYQDLSEHARKTYALLQTPEFVEEFILDLTLEPAIEEFGLHPEGGLRTIDPACGSGHFLLGIFARLVEKWRVAEPGTDDWVIVRRALDAVHGCDKNPFAASIARFRLLVAAMRSAGAGRLAEAPSFPINVAVGDSLLHGRGAAGIQTDLDTLFAEEGDRDGETFQYATEDVGEFAARVNLLGRGSYHVVVGNPPYITVKDKRESDNYRAAYSACASQYALSVPFAQRIFELAIRGAGDAQRGGFTGQITANSFMKREFGKKLIEEYLPALDVTSVIDSSVADIPGHSTPTVILIGRNRFSRPDAPVRAVLGIRGVPAQDGDPAGGLAWVDIEAGISRPGIESDWVSVHDLERSSFGSHPWSLSGGGVSEVFSFLSEASSSKLGDRVRLIGRTAHTGSDDSYFAGVGDWKRSGVPRHHVVPLVEGQVIRDWKLRASTEALFPYSDRLVADDGDIAVARSLWRHRSLLRERREPGGTHEEIGLTWFEWSRWHPERYSIPLGIAFSFVATHNHFVLDRGGKVFKQSAPVIKLPEGASEDSHLELLGLLNSSVTCFWLKQVSHSKGNVTAASGMPDQPWSWNWEFTGTKLRELPLPSEIPALGRAIDALAQELSQCDPHAVCVHSSVPTRREIDAAREVYLRTAGKMIALQEELDWQVYASYGFFGADEAETLVNFDLSSLPEINPGERAFEILLARSVAARGVRTRWFSHHGHTPVTAVPSGWPDGYKSVVQARIDAIERRKDIALVERPEYKRRWASESWEKKEKTALRIWLLNRIEDPSIWYGLRDGVKQPQALTASQLADALRGDADFNSVAQLYAADHMGKPDLPLADVLVEIVADEHVPYLGAMRYKDMGLRNREQWEEVWEKQREEDRSGRHLNIGVPPKYKSTDFQKASYWSHRGKLDVPKERFISYLEASPDADSTILLGWAGWDHKDQAQALFNLVDDRTKQAGWGTDRIKPLLAGLLEIMPWVRQWHGEYDEEWEGVPADEYQAYFEELCAKHQVSEADLRAWRPEKKTRGRKAAAPKKGAAEQAALDAE